MKELKLAKFIFIGHKGAVSYSGFDAFRHKSPWFLQTNFYLSIELFSSKEEEEAQQLFFEFMKYWDFGIC